MSEGLEHVAELAQLEEQQRQSAAPPVSSGESRSTEEILSDVAALGEVPDLARLQGLAVELTKVCAGSGQLEVRMARESFIRHTRRKVSAPAKIFDSALDAMRGPVEVAGDVQGSAISFPSTEPWLEPVDGAKLLEELSATIRRHVALLAEAADAVALWILHTYLFSAAWITPRLAITSPVKRCGKTTLLTVLEQVVSRPLSTSNVSASALFRCIEKYEPTLLIDEADTFLGDKEDLRGVLNSGHRRGGKVLRVVGNDLEPRAFRTFAPVAIAMIGKLSDTLADRSIAVEMRRRAPEETLESLRLDRLGQFEHLRARSERWAHDHAAALASADPEVPPQLNDRAADNWRPLLVLADIAGGSWPARARQAAVQLSAKVSDDDGGVGEKLLADIRTVFESEGGETIFTNTLLERLHSREDRPWPEWRRGKPITASQLARLLKPFKVSPRSVRSGIHTGKGYRRGDFEDSFRRYLPAEPSQPSQNNVFSDLPDPPSRHTSPPVTPREIAQTPANTGTVTAVTAPEEDQPEEEGAYVEC